MTTPSLLRLLALLGCFAGLGCGASAPPPVQAPATAPTAPEEEVDGTMVYSKFTDPLYLAWGEEQNVFGRRTLARLWVTTAGLDAPGDAQKARLQEAQRALDQAERAVSAQADPCQAGVSLALDRATGTKNQLEQQYLDVVEAEGESSASALRLDAQVHVLRDEVEALRILAEPCPKPMFDRADEST